MISEARKLGIDVLGAVPWGTHICHFYHTKKDLIDTLVPYFQAGLENNEFCIWITAKPLSKKEAEAAMRKAVPNFSQYLAKQQMEIIPHTEWYLQDGTYNRKRVLNTWADKLMQALASGYDGLRATGDTAWVERKDWHKLIGYEEQVNTVVGNYRILAICTYPLRKYGASQVVDIINNHHYNLIKHRGELSLVGCSEYHQMEEELWEIEDKYRLLLDNSSSAISYWDTEGKIIFTNKQGAKNNGLEEKDLLGKSLYELQPKVADFHMQRLAEIMKEGKGGRFEDKFELPDGERWFSSLFQPIIDRNGKTVGVQIISDDITELKWAEEKKDTVRKTALDGFWVINLEGRFLEVNDSYCQISGYTREELLKMSIQDLEAAENSQDVTRHIEKIVAQGSDHFETRHKRKDGRIIDIEVNVNYLDVDTGQMFGSLRDITEQKQAEEARRQLEEHYTKTFHASPHPMAITSLSDGRFSEVNEMFARDIGLSREEIIGHTTIELGIWTDSEERARLVQLLQQRGHVHDFPTHLYNTSGEIHEGRLSATLIEHNGEPCIIGATTDVTRRKLIEEKEHTIVNTALDGFWTSDLESRFLEVNDSYCQMTGYTREELLKMSIHDIEAAESNEEITQRIQKIKEQGSDHFESRHKRKDDRIIDVEINVNYLDIEQGQMFVFIRDITERKQAEKELREIEEFSANLLTYSPHPIIVINPDTSVRYVNPALEKLTGFSAEEIVGGKTPYPWWTPETLQGTHRDLREAMRQGAVGLEELFQKKNGERFWVEISSTPVKHEGKLKYYRASWIDITEKKQAEIGRMMPLRPTSGRRMIDLQKRFIIEGFEGLEDQEIIELLLILVLPARKAKQLAIACLEKFKNLSDFLTASPKELQQIGITPASMFYIKLLHELPIKILKQRIMARSIYKSSRDVFNYLYYSMRDLKNEVFKVIYLDNRSQIIDTVDLFEGTHDIIPVRPREIIESAIEHNAKGLIFVHNHPTGDPTPSKADKQLTRDLVFVGNILQINVLDHIIIGADSFFSFADDGLIHKYQDNFFNLKIRGILASATVYRHHIQSHKGLHYQH